MGWRNVHNSFVKSYLVSFGPPQREEAGEEELAPADDGSQAPVEASHACVCPVLSASLLSLFPHPPPTPPPAPLSQQALG